MEKKIQRFLSNSSLVIQVLVQLIEIMMLLIIIGVIFIAIVILVLYIVSYVSTISFNFHFLPNISFSFYNKNVA